MERKTLHKISYGLYVICSKNKEKINGQIANAVFQVTSEPPTIAFSINKNNLTHQFITESKEFSISILNEKTSLPFIGTFGFKSGREINKFQKISYKLAKNNTPVVLDYTLAYLEGAIMSSIDADTHTIFIGNVQDAHILTDEPAMTYEYYHTVKGGYSPKSAPTYSSDIDKKKENKEEKPMDKYVCKVCGYVYDPATGDPDSGIAAGTKFEDIPDDWVCPICGAGKEAFEKQ